MTGSPPLWFEAANLENSSGEHCRLLSRVVMPMKTKTHSEDLQPHCAFSFPNTNFNEKNPFRSSDTQTNQQVAHKQTPRRNLCHPFAVGSLLLSPPGSRVLSAELLSKLAKTCDTDVGSKLNGGSSTVPSETPQHTKHTTAVRWVNVKSKSYEWTLGGLFRIFQKPELWP